MANRNSQSGSTAPITPSAPKHRNVTPSVHAASSSSGSPPTAKAQRQRAPPSSSAALARHSPDKGIVGASKPPPAALSEARDDVIASGEPGDDVEVRELTQLAQPDPDDDVVSDDEGFRPQLAQPSSQAYDILSQGKAVSETGCQSNRKHGQSSPGRDVGGDTALDTRRSLRQNVRQLHEDSKLAKKLQEEEERSAAREKAARNLRPRWQKACKMAGDLPCARWGHSASLVKQDPPTLLLTGGDSVDVEGQVVTLPDAWEFDSSANRWKRLDDDAAVARSFHSAAVVEHEGADGEAQKLLVVFGGEINTPGCKEVLGALRILCLEDRIWFHPRVSGAEPPPRSGHTCSFFRDNLVFFGGVKDETYYNDVHVLDTNNWNWFTPPIEGTPPSARAYHAALVCHPSDGGAPFMLVVGGDTPTCVENDVHQLDLITWEWRKITLRGPEKMQPACGHSAAMLGPPTCTPCNAASARNASSLGRYVLLHGGWGTNGKFKDAGKVQVLDTHEWRLCSVVPDMQAPADCAGHSLTFLEDSHLVALFGRAPDETLLSQMTHLRLRSDTTASLFEAPEQYP